MQEVLREYQRQENASLSILLAKANKRLTDLATAFSSSNEENLIVQNVASQPNLAHLGVCVLTINKEKARALKECYYSLLARYFSARKTLKKLLRYYTQKSIRKNVATYYSDYLLCKRATAARHKLYSLLALLLLPTRAQKEVTFNFITKLSLSKVSRIVYNTIIVVVCRLTKIAYYILARGDQNGSNLAQAQIREVVCLYKVLARVISNRGFIISAKYQKTFNQYINSKRVLTLAYYLQTNSQIERQNQTLEQYLRIYYSLKQDNQAFFILVAEFAYNDSVYATTEVTLFCANYEIDLRSVNQPIIALGNGKLPIEFQVALKVLSI